MTRGSRPECSRSPNGRHDIVRGAVAEYCRFCWVIPRYIEDFVAGETRIVPATIDTPKVTVAPDGRKVVGPLKGNSRLNSLKACAERDGGWACFYCERPLKDPVEAAMNDPDAPTLDHVLPRSLGGRNRLDNLVIACLECNGLKANHVRLLATVIKRLRAEVVRLRESADQDARFIDQLKWELHDAGLGEMPGRVTLNKGPRKKARWQRPRPAISDVAWYVELGERTVANMRAENVGGRHGRTAAIVKRGRLLKRREAAMGEAR